MRMRGAQTGRRRHDSTAQYTSDHPSPTAPRRMRRSVDMALPSTDEASWADDATWVDRLDDGVFATALDFLESIDAPAGGVPLQSTPRPHSSSISSPDSSRSSDGDAAKNRPRPRRGAKDEIERLREQLTTLETTRASLTRRLEARRSFGSQEDYQRDAKRRSGNWTRKITNSAWENIATRQLARRRAAEATNRKLNTAVLEQNRLLNELQRLIQQHETRVKANKLLGVGRKAPALMNGLVNGVAVLDTLTSVLSPMYMRTNALFADPRLVKPWEAHFYESKAERCADGLTVQRLESRILPFEYDPTRNSAWDVFRSLSGPCERFQSEYDASEETYYSKHVQKVRAGGFDGHFQADMVLCRVDEAERMVILRSSMFTFIEGQCEDNCLAEFWQQGIPVRHLLWVTVSKPSHGTEDAASPPLVQVQTCSISQQAIPKHFTQTEVAVVNRFASDICNQMLTHAHEELESMMLSAGTRELVAQ